MDLSEHGPAGVGADPRRTRGQRRHRGHDAAGVGLPLQTNVKTKEGSLHPDRDAQFRYLKEQAREFHDGGQPVVSVHAKKKELIGEFKNVGREVESKGRPMPRPAP